jgi:Carboxypeptidase regulatory-like domain
MKATIKFIVTAVIFTLYTAVANAQIASNPPFTLEQSVIAAGGGTSANSGNVYKVEGTIGQPVAGTNSTKTPFAVRGGFFTPAPFGVTAAPAKISGRISTADGYGIPKVSVTMTNSSGSLRTTLSSSFGYYSFDDVPVGDVYILSVSVKQFQFSENVRVIFVLQDTDVNFIADPK